MITITESMFDKGKVEEVQKQFVDVKIDDFQDAMATSMVELLSNFIPLSKMAMKGFIIFSFRDWQKKNNAFLADMNKPGVTLEEKFKITEEINSILLDKLTLVLRDAKNKDQLKEGIQKGNEILKDMLRKQQG